jgi:hypothetical protein
MQVLDLTRDPQVNTRQLKECIENDPAMVGRVLRVVNSSLFGLSREVSDLNQALALLGITPLKLLVLSFSLPNGLFLALSARTLGWYWRHTLTKAVAAREMSWRLWRIAGDEAFLAGLFHDLGMLLLLQELGRPYARFLDRAIAGRLDIGELEARSLGFSHTALSARLLTQWKLPQALIEAIAWQPGAGRASGLGQTEEGRGDAGTRGGGAEQPSRLAQILHISELVAQLLADGRPDALGRLLEAGREYHCLLEPQLEALVGDLEEKVRQLADILSLQLPGGMEYRDVLATAHRQLAGVASRAAEDLLHGGQSRAAQTEEEALLGEFQDLARAVSAACRSSGQTSASARDRALEERRGEGETRRRGEGIRQGPVPASPRPRVPASQCPPGPAAAADPSLADRLAQAVAASRQTRRGLSLLLVEAGGLEKPQTVEAAEGIATPRQLLEAACAVVDHPGKICVPYGAAGCALILPDCERRRAVQLGGELVRAVQASASGGGPVSAPSPLRSPAPPKADAARPTTPKLAVGVATIALPTKNFLPATLLDGASRCLYGSHASGGTVVKSIEIY